MVQTQSPDAVHLGNLSNDTEASIAAALQQCIFYSSGAPCLNFTGLSAGQESFQGER